MGFNWSAGRQNNKLMYQFTSVLNVEPSTMQTKIRAMIRYGFLKDINQPIKCGKTAFFEIGSTEPLLSVFAN